MENPKKKINADKKKKIIKFFIPFVMLLMIVIIGTTAWFTMNRETAAGGLFLRGSDVPFEIASFGSDGEYDSKISYIAEGENSSAGYDIYELKKGSDKFENSGRKLIKDTERSFFSKITGKNSTIQWMVNGESNFANYKSTENNRDNINDEEEKLEYRLEPGDNGFLEFYIIPKINGDLNLRFTLDIDLFEKNLSAYDYDSALKFNDEDKMLQQQLLMHHILFFKDYDETGYSGLLGFKPAETEGETDIIDFGNDYVMTYTSSIPNAKKDAAYLFRVYWIWPNTFGQVILPADNSILNTRNRTVWKDTAEKTAYINMMKSDYSQFLYLASEDTEENEQPGSDNTADDEQSEINILIENTAKGLNLDESDTNNDYYKLSYYWNRADQYIGTNIGYITAEMKVNVNE